MITAGLTAAEAAFRLARDGPNALPDTRTSTLRDALAKFWAPVPWLLEASMILGIALGKFLEAAVIAALLVFNAVLAFVQESRAQATLNALRSRLALSASVRRDGAWTSIPAAGLVTGDLVQLTLGGVVAADIHLVSGSVSLDQSMLTGESLPIEAGPGTSTFAGALVRRGEATAVVTATGSRTKFGKTAELVRTAGGASSQQTAVLKIVRYLGFFNAAVIVLLGAYAATHAMRWNDVIPLVLTSILAAIPVGLPATFTLTAALGARSLARLGVLPTRLSAVDEAATIDVLCVDKTGTLTANQLAVTAVHAFPGATEAYVLGLAALASSEGGEDPVDTAIRSAALKANSPGLPARNTFLPFDPDRKTAEATATGEGGQHLRIVKGAYAVLAKTSLQPPGAGKGAEVLEAQGYRVLAVAAGSSEPLAGIGLIALSDPPRSDSAALIAELHALGVTTIMITGDAPGTAAIVARDIGLTGAVCPPGSIPGTVKPADFAVYAGILPEGKFHLVKAFQAAGHTVGMCGDGANDAPALRQAQIGIAVSTATDVAKSAAGVVLTEPGLIGIVAAIKEGRRTFQRILSYVLRSTTKKITQLLLLAIGLLMTGSAVLTPLLMVIIMITGDFLSMAYATDRVSESAHPNTWSIGKITLAGGILGSCFLLFCTATLAYGQYRMHLPIAALRTLCVIAIVYGGQAVTYAIRDRQHFWGLRPTKWLVASSAADILLITLLAHGGIGMTRLPLSTLIAQLLAALAFGLVLNALKIPIFRRLSLE